MNSLAPETLRSLGHSFATVAQLMEETEARKDVHVFDMDLAAVQQLRSIALKLEDLAEATPTEQSSSSPH